MSVTHAPGRSLRMILTASSYGVLTTCATLLYTLDMQEIIHFPSDTHALVSREVRVFQTGCHKRIFLFQNSFL